MSHGGRIRRCLVPIAAATAALAMLAMSAPVRAHPHTQPKTSSVRDWNALAVGALTNASAYPAPCAAQAPNVAPLHLAMTQGAVYDAVNAIVGRYEPYLHGLPHASRHASKDAAVATAAHDVLETLVCPQIVADLDTALTTSLDAISDGQSKTKGIAIGAAAAAKMIQVRSGDGRFGAPGFPYPANPSPGDWRPIPTTGTPPPPSNDPNAWVRDVRPFLLVSAEQVRTHGPYPLQSFRYAKDFWEVKRLGSATGTARTTAQTELARFYTDRPDALWNSTFRAISEQERLSVAEEARLFAMLNMAGADAFIGCWDDKARWNFWRPLTAIQLADTDGNKLTKADPTWTPLVPNPPYPDHPSGYNCYTGAIMNTARAFFGHHPVTFTVHSNATGAGPDRTYDRFLDVVKDTIDARVLLGIHFRNPDVQGAGLGRDVARWMLGHDFQPVC